MLRVIASMVIGYLLGSLSPSALLSKIKNRNLKESGTGNLGATNTMLVFGWKCGIMVMVIDVLKAYFAVKIAGLLMPDVTLVGVLAGCCAIVGHIFPFYLKFKGGKGVATLAGLFLAIDPIAIPILLGIGLVFAIVLDYGIAAPVSASLIAPFLVGFRMESLGVFLVLMFAGVLVAAKHMGNMDRIKEGTEMKFSEFLHGEADVDEVKEIEEQ